MRNVVLPGIIIAVVLGAALLTRSPGATAATREVGPPLDTDVIIYLRGDGTGADRVPSFGDHHSGKIENYDNDWMRLAGSDGKTYWFPRSTILSVVQERR